MKNCGIANYVILEGNNGQLYFTTVQCLDTPSISQGVTESPLRTSTLRQSWSLFCSSPRGPTPFCWHTNLRKSKLWEEKWFSPAKCYRNPVGHLYTNRITTKLALKFCWPRERGRFQTFLGFQGDGKSPALWTEPSSECPGIQSILVRGPSPGRGSALRPRPTNFTQYSALPTQVRVSTSEGKYTLRLPKLSPKWPELNRAGRAQLGITPRPEGPGLRGRGWARLARHLCPPNETWPAEGPSSLPGAPLSPGPRTPYRVGLRPRAQVVAGSAASAPFLGAEGHRGLPQTLRACPGSAGPSPPTPRSRGPHPWRPAHLRSRREVRARRPRLWNWDWAPGAGPGRTELRPAWLCQARTVAWGSGGSVPSPPPHLKATARRALERLLKVRANPPESFLRKVAIPLLSIFEKVWHWMKETCVLWPVTHGRPCVLRIIEGQEKQNRTNSTF